MSLVTTKKVQPGAAGSKPSERNAAARVSPPAGASYTLAHATAPFPAHLASNLPRPWALARANGGKTLKLCYRRGSVLVVR